MIINALAQRYTDLLPNSSGDQESKMSLTGKQNQSVSGAVLLLESWGENLFPCLSQLWEAAGFLFFGSWSLSNSKQVIASLWPLLLLSPSLLWFCVSCHPCDYIRPVGIIWDNLPSLRSLTRSAKSLWPHQVTSSQVWGLQMWTSLRGHLSATGLVCAGQQVLLLPRMLL